MIERRDLLRGVAFGAALATAQAVSACSFAEYDDDDWGAKLIRFLKTGDGTHLDTLFRDFSTLMAFDDGYLSGPKLYFEGQGNVREALVSFRKQMTRKGWVEPSKMLEAKLIGSQQQGRMNQISLLFGEGVTSETSCGPDRSERRVDLYYQAGVYETGYDWTKWAIKRIAILPPLELEKFNG